MRAPVSPAPRSTTRRRAARVRRAGTVTVGVIGLIAAAIAIALARHTVQLGTELVTALGSGTAHAAAVEDFVAVVITGVGTLLAAWLATSAALCLCCAAARGAGRVWRAGERLTSRIAPRALRRLTTTAVGTGVAMAIGLAPAHAAVDLDPSWQPTETEAAATPEQPVPVEEPTEDPAEQPAPPRPAVPPTPQPAEQPAEPRPEEPTVQPTGPGPNPQAPSPGPSGAPAAPRSPSAATGGETDSPSSATPAPATGAESPARPSPAAPQRGAPTAPTGPAPTPAAPGPATGAAQRGTVTVATGDSLWTIAAAHLPPDATDAEISAAWPRWHAANRSVIGADPDLIHPGQILHAPTDDPDPRSPQP